MGKVIRELKFRYVWDPYNYHTPTLHKGYIIVTRTQSSDVLFMMPARDDSYLTTIETTCRGSPRKIRMRGENLCQAHMHPKSLNVTEVLMMEHHRTLTQSRIHRWHHQTIHNQTNQSVSKYWPLPHQGPTQQQTKYDTIAKQDRYPLHIQAANTTSLHISPNMRIVRSARTTNLLEQHANPKHTGKVMHFQNLKPSVMQSQQITKYWMRMMNLGLNINAHVLSKTDTHISSEDTHHQHNQQRKQLRLFKQWDRTWNANTSTRTTSWNLQRQWMNWDSVTTHAHHIDQKQTEWRKC